MKTSILWVISILCFASFANAQNTTPDSITITFKVVVPENTPENATIFWTGSLNHWDPGNQGRGFGAKDYALPLKHSDDKWIIKITAQKGKKALYKYTRGSIYSAEEQADYTYHPARTIIFNESKTIIDTVRVWHDIPPEALKKSWPLINLKRTQIPVTYNGTLFNYRGTILYDKAMGSIFYNFYKENILVQDAPENFFEAVYYYQKIYPAPQNIQLIAAAKTGPERPWYLYVDKNTDQSISLEEKVMKLNTENKKAQSWTGKVPYFPIGKAGVDSVKLTIQFLTNLPEGYRSSIIDGAPNLGFKLPVKQKQGKLNGNIFYVQTNFPTSFTDYHTLLIDHNHNDTLEVGSGSNEIFSISFNKMHLKQKFYLYYSFKLGNQFWQIASISPTGNWIRLRPTTKKEGREPITAGAPAPVWKAVTLSGDTLSSESLKGNYVLLDFWGSWCGPCRKEIPLLKQAYFKFKNQNFKMVGFAYESEKSLEKAMEEYDLLWPQVLDNKGTYSAKFLVRGYPTHYLIGPDGEVLEMGSALRGEKLISTLEKYLE